MPAYYKTLRTVVLVIATILMVVAAYFAGVQLADDDSTRGAFKAAFIVAGAPGLILMVFILFVLLNVAWRVRMDGTRLIGVGVIGPVGVDLAELNRVKDTTSRQGPYLALRDDQLSMMVSYKTLSERRVVDQVVEAAARQQARGAVTVSRGAAALLRLPVSTAAGARTAPAQGLAITGVVVLFFVGMIVGLTA